MIKFFIVIICSFFCSCFMSQKTTSLPGKIAVKLGDTTYIYNHLDKNIRKLKISTDNGKSYGGFRWVNNEEKFIAIEYFSTKTTGISRGSIVCLDISGNIIERLYEAQEGEIAGSSYLSRSDKQLLFTIEKKGDTKDNPIEGLIRQKTIIVMDFNERSIIKRIENIGTSLSFEICESPWLFDETKFIFSISDEKKIISEENVALNSTQENIPGVYIYDMVTGHSKILIPKARLGICSPVENRISYFKNNAVWVMDLKDNSSKIVYKVGQKDRATNIHWTPDGKFIYLAFYNYNRQNDGRPIEKLIDVKTGKEVPFNKLEHGFYPYTWK